jgi:quercetin dioxygenase-like cupin family protein
LLEYEVEGQRFSLAPGDSLLFSAQLEHRWRNSSPSATKVLIVLSGFNKGESPLEYHLTSGKDSDS